MIFGKITAKSNSEDYRNRTVYTLFMEEFQLNNISCQRIDYSL